MLVNASDAFAKLSRCSQDTNGKLVVIAAEAVTKGRRVLGVGDARGPRIN